MKLISLKAKVKSYVIGLIVSILFSISLNCNAQVVKQQGDRVSIDMTLQQYRAFTYKWNDCSELAQVNDSIEKACDTLSSRYVEIIRNYNQILLQKDSTIRVISEEYREVSEDYQQYVEDNQPTIFERYFPLGTFIIGLFGGVYLAK